MINEEFGIGWIKLLERLKRCWNIFMLFLEVDGFYGLEYFMLFLEVDGFCGLEFL
jgi:hypothetical protein